MFTHIRFRRRNGKPEGKCRLCGFPYSSLFTLLGLIIAMVSMPFIKGQTAGFLAGISLVAFFSICYVILKVISKRKLPNLNSNQAKRLNNPQLSTEFSEEIHDVTSGKK